MTAQRFEYWLEEQLEIGDHDYALEPGTARFSTPVGFTQHDARTALIERVTFLQAQGWHVEPLGGETYTAAKGDAVRTLWLAGEVQA